MRAIHWIRSRQESEELSYWLSFVSYNPKDRSLNNRIYLVYLLVFFSIWWFIVLVWFASTGASLLSLVFPSSVMDGAIGLELVILLLWFLTVLFLSLWLSPVAFSEEDAYLVCQMPLRPRPLVLRWSLMPWVKSVIPFLILAMVLGFSLAEIDLSQQGVTDPNIFAYIIRGVRAALGLLPIHLAAFGVIWANGVWLMSRQRRFAAWIVPVLTVGLVGLLFGAGLLASFGVGLPAWLMPFSQFLPGLLRAGFTQGMLGRALQIGGVGALVSFAALYLSAGRFSPSQAAQETQVQVTNQNLLRYGFSDQVSSRKAQKRLGIVRRTAWLPGWQGAASLTWKDVIQTWRSINLSYGYYLFTFFGAGLGLVFIPSLGGRILLVLTWAMQATKFLTGRLREDLAHWVLLRQLPQKPQDWILADMVFPSAVLLLVSLLGIVGGAALGNQSPWVAMLCMPGMIASAAGVSASMIFRHSKIDLLMSGQAPGINEFGILLTAVSVAVPVAFFSLVPGLMGAALAMGASLLIGGIALSAAFRAFRAIE